MLAKLGRRHYKQQLVPKRDPRDKEYFWIGGGELGFDDIPGTDCNAVSRDLPTLTPLRLDLTDYRGLEQLQDWTELNLKNDLTP